MFGVEVIHEEIHKIFTNPGSYIIPYGVTCNGYIIAEGITFNLDK